MRRIPLLLVVLLAIAGTVLVSRDKLSADRAVFSTAAVGWMPSAPPEQGLTENGKHHEIYLSDPRRAAPGKLKTILRQPVRTRKPGEKTNWH